MTTVHTPVRLESDPVSVYLMRLPASFSFACSVRSDIDAEVIQSEVADLPGAYIPLILDVTDASAIKAAAYKVGIALGEIKLGALINNAGKLYRYIYMYMSEAWVGCTKSISYQLSDKCGHKRGLFQDSGSKCLGLTFSPTICSIPLE